MEDESGKSGVKSKSGSGGKRRRLWMFGKLKLKGAWRWRWSFWKSAFKWKRHTFQLSLIDDLMFKIVSVFEAIVLVANLCFFYLCCGCHV
ncbi:hypothetical protein K2173_009473 [Erythroxylum novogranatense]|uniref:Uncharacterized protein n=1 Tax=Erythroxylum novogranatense TaxID=1862640 RepID=A0AAV8U416_9ROSI|nr:hypothetical protein K2173_009473 [Erythroxylum novogranatense]